MEMVTLTQKANTAWSINTGTSHSKTHVALHMRVCVCVVLSEQELKNLPLVASLHNTTCFLVFTTLNFPSNEGYCHHTKLSEGVYKRPGLAALTGGILPWPL